MANLQAHAKTLAQILLNHLGNGKRANMHTPFFRLCTS